MTCRSEEKDSILRYYDDSGRELGWSRVDYDDDEAIRRFAKAAPRWTAYVKVERRTGHE